MKIGIRTLILLIICNISLSSQTFDYCRDESANLIALLEKYHVNPPDIDDSFSQHVFDKFILQLDPNRIYFTSEDIAGLYTFRFNIDNELKGESWNFLNAIKRIFENNLFKADSLIHKVLEKPFDFLKDDSISFPDSDSLVFKPKGLSYESWVRKYLKYKVLRQSVIPIWNEDSTRSNFNIKMLPENEARQKILLKETQKIKKYLKNPSELESHLSSIFLNCIASCADPHTEYMSYDEKQYLDKALSSEGMSFGFSLDENVSGEIEITRIAPGSPAWKTNSLNKGDVIIQAGWKGKEKIDFARMDLDEINDFFVSTEKTLELTVRKTDGSIKTLEITKEKIQQDDNIVRGYLLNGNLKAGYIMLPGFYTDFENENGLGCANDVAKEILKLQKDGIKGLILDLRFNGGGSIREAQDLAGIFINYGPVCMLKEKPENVLVLKDLNRGTIFNGPLILLVNGQSASASEIVAGALQDYHRAVVAGSATYGKATGQIIIPCDSTFDIENGTNHPAKSKSGYLKITTSRIYRITGNTIQKTGVQPEISLPGSFSGQFMFEKDEPFALNPDTLSRRTYYTPLSELPVDQLRQMSMNRIKENIAFQQLKVLHDSLTTLASQSIIIPLNQEKYFELMKKYYVLLKNMNTDADSEDTIYSTSLPAFDRQLQTIYPENTEIYQSQFKQIDRDVYIQEAYNILTDYLNLLNISK